MDDAFIIRYANKLFILAGGNYGHRIKSRFSHWQFRERP